MGFNSGFKGLNTLPLGYNNPFMQYGEIIAVCSDIHSKHIGWYVEYFNVKPGGTLSNQSRVLLVVWKFAEIIFFSFIIIQWLVTTHAIGTGGKFWRHAVLKTDAYHNTSISVRLLAKANLILFTRKSERFQGSASNDLDDTVLLIRPSIYHKDPNRTF